MRRALPVLILLAALALLILWPLALFSAEVAVPAARAADWLADPASAAQRAAEQAKQTAGVGAGVLAALATAGAAALWLIGRVAPWLPGAGPIVGKIADMGWQMLATRDQKQADAAAHSAAQVLAGAKPALDALVEGLPDLVAKLPPEARTAIDAVRRAGGAQA